MAGARNPQAFDVETYATLTVALADGGRSREEVLGEQGLDEESWAALDQFWQDQLSAALDEDVDGVPPLVAAYAAAFDRARAASRAGAKILSIERFADATREIQRRGDPVAALAHVGVTLADFLRANEHWTRRMVEDPDLLQRFRSRLG
jgi:hypothetical protein